MNRILLLVYENFKFDGNDLNQIGINYKTNITTNKISSDRIVNKILKLDTTLITRINNMIED